MPGSPSEIQHAYYTATSDRYDAAHLHEDDEHNVALHYIAALSRAAGCRSLLDVGAGTGRGMRYMRRRWPESTVTGVEPVRALIERAIEDNGIPSDDLVQADGEQLPFPDDSFDVAYETGVFHHLQDPEKVLAEMMRVAKTAVFLSDDNRFGAGPRWLRLTKFALYRTGLFSLANRVRHGGRPYRLTEGDGLSYSYSVYDSLETLVGWGGRTFLIPTDRVGQATWSHPLLTSTHVLLCAIRDQSEDST